MFFGGDVSVQYNELQNIQAVYRLNRKKYLKRSKLVCIFLKRRGKMSHILRTRPKEGDPNFLLKINNALW